MRSRTPATLPTGLLLVATLLAFGLAGWRATSLLAPSPVHAEPAGSSLLEQRLTGLLSTVLGAGEAQVHQSIRPDGSRAFLVLVNAAPATDKVSDETLVDLVSSAVFIDTIAGDTITVRRAVFAASGSSLPGRGEALELAGLVGLGLMLAGLAVISRMENPVEPARQTAASMPARSAMPMASAPAGMDTRLAARRIGENPQRAAAVIRGWLSREGGEA
jgi:hypothetical protein